MLLSPNAAAGVLVEVAVVLLSAVVIGLPLRMLRDGFAVATSLLLRAVLVGLSGNCDADGPLMAEYSIHASISHSYHDL